MVYQRVWNIGGMIYGILMTDYPTKMGLYIIIIIHYCYSIIVNPLSE